MTKVTKTEKILRKATGKWEKFLAEGAFNEAPVNEMTMGERGMVDAQDGNPPSKIGHGNEEYMAAFNAVMQKMGKEPLPIVKPDQAYLDALQRGNLEEAAEADPRVVAMQQAIALLDDLQFDSLESALDNMNTEVVRKLSIMMKELDFKRNKVGNIEENGKKNFQVGEFVYVVNGSLKGASGKILEPVTTTTGEEGFAIELYSDADKKLFGQRGDEVIAVAGDLESGGTTDGMELYDIDEKLSAAALTMESNPSSFATRVTHSSDPEMDQVMDIAADMLELGARSRIPVSLVGVESALQKQGFDTKMEKGKLIVDDKYVIADKSSLPDTAQKISFTKYAADYLSNIEGEQQDLPLS